MDRIGHNLLRPVSTLGGALRIFLKGVVEEAKR